MVKHPRKIVVIFTLILFLTPLVMVLSTFLVRQIDYAEVVLDDLNSLQEGALNVVLERTSLTIYLALINCAATGSVLLWSSQKQRSDQIWKWAAYGSFSCCALSIFMGYLFYDTLGWLLHNNIFNYENNQLYWTEFLQIILLILSIAFLGSLFHSAVFRKERQ